MAAQARRILLAYDGTESSRRALDAAADVAGYGSTLTVVGVNGRSAILADARERLVRRQVVARFVEPAVELLDAARDVSADLVVVGRGPTDGPAGERLSAIVSDAPCDVLVVI